MSIILVSFVHGYQNDDVDLDKEVVPCLVSVDSLKREVIDVYSLEFPRTPADFSKERIDRLLLGESPMPSQQVEFKKLPRFGVMGLAQSSGKIYAATWNGIYVIGKKTMKEESFISHRLINDPHGIQVVDDRIYSILTALDLVVVTDCVTGEILDHFSVDRALNVIRDSNITNFDWRFISKQHRGAVGNWHFNHIRVEGQKVFLTSRLTSSLVEVDLEKNTASIRTVCWDTPVMLHDGRLFSDGNLVFTSVDGKILIAKPAGEMGTGISSMNDKAFHSLMKRDMVNTSIRMGKILSKEINWCRGIEDIGNYYVTTTEGRYEQDYPFFNITFVDKASETVDSVRIPYDMVDFPNEIRYMTGFSVMKLSSV